MGGLSIAYLAACAMCASFITSTMALATEGSSPSSGSNSSTSTSTSTSTFSCPPKSTCAPVAKPSVSVLWPGSATISQLLTPGTNTSVSTSLSTSCSGSVCIAFSPVAHQTVSVVWPGSEELSETLYIPVTTEPAATPAQTLNSPGPTTGVSGRVSNSGLRNTGGSMASSTAPSVSNSNAPASATSSSMPSDGVAGRPVQSSLAMVVLVPLLYSITRLSLWF